MGFIMHKRGLKSGLASAVGSVMFFTIFLNQTVCGQSAESWFEAGKAAIEKAKNQTIRNNKAKNVILFVGDGMGIATITAARIREGQLRGQSGEENSLSFESFPFTALSKTYNTNQQIPDSAGTMTAMVTGYKTKAGILSLSDRNLLAHCDGPHANELKTILESAEELGMGTGVVTTTRVTHATPAATYAHIPHRDWENDALVPPEAKAAGCHDIAQQLVEFSRGDGIDVVFGGGRRDFTTESVIDPEKQKGGKRTDGRNLIQEWMMRSKGNTYVWNQEGFNHIDSHKVSHVMGLFNYDHMEFDADRKNDVAGEPSIAEMTTKAIDILSQKEKGYFLMVEGGRIDHAHHAGNAYRALTDTIAFSNAVKAALQKVDLNDTLIIVTADHSHVFTMGGYPQRGNPILGKVIHPEDDGTPSQNLALDAMGLPFTTLNYMNGPGFLGKSDSQPEGLKTFPHAMKSAESSSLSRPNLTEVDTKKPSYLQESLIPLEDETHSGEDVAIFANGPRAHLLHGVVEQNVIYHLMVEALGWNP